MEIMLNNKQKIIRVISILVIIFLVSIIIRYPLLYYYYLLRLSSTLEGSEIITYEEKIEAISTNVIPLLVYTYENEKASHRSRHVAALGLIKADKEKAEDLFMKFLVSDNCEILADAIRHLGILKSVKPYVEIIKLVNAQSGEIRWAVADYFGNIDKNESRIILRQMMKSDSDENVRNWAQYRLWLLGDYTIKSNTQNNNTD